MNCFVKQIQLSAMLLALCIFSMLATGCGGKAESNSPAAESEQTTSNEVDESAATANQESEQNVSDEAAPADEQPVGTKIDVSADELKKMSTFLSNFVEVGLIDFDQKSLSRDELISFALWHNYRNNFKNRIVPCKLKNCEHGSLTIDPKYISESIKKYFGKDFKDHASITEPYKVCYFDGKLYYFEGADGDVLQAAKVKEVFKVDNGELRMTGDIVVIDHDGVEEKAGTFDAFAKPYKFDGKDTWSIISFMQK